MNEIYEKISKEMFGKVELKGERYVDSYGTIKEDKDFVLTFNGRLIGSFTNDPFERTPYSAWKVIKIYLEADGGIIVDNESHSLYKGSELYSHYPLSYQNMRELYSEEKSYLKRNNAECLIKYLSKFVKNPFKYFINSLVYSE